MSEFAIKNENHFIVEHLHIILQIHTSRTRDMCFSAHSIIFINPISFMLGGEPTSRSRATAKIPYVLKENLKQIKNTPR